MAGAGNTIPFRYGRVELDTPEHKQEYMNIPTDLYFSDFNGDWNVDGGDKYGEDAPSDNPDFYQEIGVGRIPVKTQI